MNLMNKMKPSSTSADLPSKEVKKEKKVFITTGRIFLLLALILLFFFGNGVVFGKVVNRLCTFSYFLQPIFILYFISVIEKQLEALNVFKKFENFLAENRLTRLSYVLIPGLIGLIPSIGGAQFACSMFPKTSSKDFDNIQLASVNYYFRHFHVYSNPMIAGTILACAITHTNLLIVGAVLFPLSCLTFYFGWKWLIPAQASNTWLKKRNDFIFNRSFFTAILFIACIGLICFILGQGLLLWLALVSIFLGFMKPEKLIINFLPTRQTSVLLIEIAFILFFAAVINSIGLKEVFADMVSSNLFQPVLALSLVTILLAFLTGISQAYVAIVMPLLSFLPGNHLLLICWLLALGFFVQYMTPAHLCLVVCSSYYKCSPIDILKLIYRPLLISFLIWSLLILFWLQLETFF